MAADVLDEWANWLYAEEGLPGKTVDNYVKTLLRLRDSKGQLEDLTEADLLAFQRECDPRAAATWDTWRAHIQNFYRWYARTRRLPDPSHVLTRRSKPRRPVPTHGLADKIAKLPPTARMVARLTYLTGLELKSVYQLVEQGPTEPVATVEGRRGTLKQVRMDEDIRELVDALRREGITERQKRSIQKAFKAAKLKARDVTTTANLDRRHGDVFPALTALLGHTGMEKVEIAFRAALVKLESEGSAPDAIPDAARALHEMLVRLGARGQTLKNLAHSARDQRLVAPHDTKLADAVDLLIEWVSADRVVRGDAHHTRPEATDDAWLTVRIVGAMLMRLEKRLR